MLSNNPARTTAEGTMKTEISTDHFADFGLQPAIVEALAEQGCEHVTLLQQLVVPVLLDGRDTIAQAPAASGKTTAFVASTPERIDPDLQQPQVCVLAPTREATRRLTELFRHYVGHLPNVQIASIMGGEGYGLQISQLKRGAHIVIGTPSRLMDLIREQNLPLQNLRVLVLDDVDELVQLGFGEDIKRILAAAGADRQTIMCCTTMTDEVRQLAEETIPDAEHIVLEEPAVAPDPPVQVEEIADGAEEGAEEGAPEVEDLLAPEGAPKVDSATDAADEPDTEPTAESSAASSESDEREPQDPVALLKQRLATIIAESQDEPPGSLDAATSFIMDFLAENPNATMLQLSSALTKLALEWAGAGELPETVQRRPAQRYGSRDSSDFRGRGRSTDRGPRERGDRERGNRDRRPEGRTDGNRQRGGHRSDSRSASNGNLARYRIEVGHDHGVRPGNIVGAITGSSDIQGWQIGSIDIQNRFSTIDLPGDLPEQLLRDLGQVRVAGQALRISKWNARPGGQGRFGDQPRKFNRKKQGKPTWKKGRAKD